MSLRFGLGALLLVTAGLHACGASAPSADAPVKTEPATVRFIQVETGCWVLETAAGRVQPVDLPEAFRQDGLAVEVVLRDAPAMMSACQVGPLKTVEHIAKR
jgi:hypothetical protein